MPIPFRLNLLLALMAPNPWLQLSVTHRVGSEHCHCYRKPHLKVLPIKRMQNWTCARSIKLSVISAIKPGCSAWNLPYPLFQPRMLAEPSRDWHCLTSILPNWIFASTKLDSGWQAAEQTGDRETNPLIPSSERMLRNFVQVPETISVLGLKIPVGSTRVISSILFLLSTGAFVYLAYTLSKLSKTSREADIRLRYSPLLVDVHNRPEELGRTVIDVASIQDLARLAERNNVMMLHEPNGNGNHTYLVQGDGTLYRFEVAENGPVSQISTLVFKEEELRQAMEGDQFELVYQPMYDINQRQITGVEALLRWNHPILGTLPPSAFIADAESTGLINQLGEWVIQTACGQLREWEKAGVQPVSLAINVSSKQLLPGLPRLVKNAIKEFKLKPAQLQLEFTEAQLIENMDRNIVVLDALKALGVEISIDNYTGQASVIHLARLRAKNLKFALALIEQMKNPEMAAITLGTIAAARTLGMVIEAVGVETEEQLDFLRSQLVTSAQGYLLGKPVAANDALQTLFGIGRQVTVLPDPVG